MHVVLKASFAAKDSFWIRNRIGEDGRKFSTKKAVQTFRKRLREYMTAGERHFWAFAITKIVTNWATSV